MRARGWRVDCLVRRADAPEAQLLAELGCSLVVGDITVADGLVEAMASADVVVHNAGVYEIGATKQTAARMQSVNVEGTESVLSAARMAGVPKTIYVSSVVALDPEVHDADPARPAGAPFRDPRFCTPYSRSKAAAHEVALRHRAEGLALVNVMPNVVVGPDDHSAFGHFIRLHIMGRNLPLAFGADCRIAPIDVDSLAEGICLAADRGEIGEDYCFGGASITFKELFQAFAEQPGGMKVRLYLPRWFMGLQMPLFAWLLRRMGLTAFLSPELVRSSRADYDFSSAKAEQELGWRRPDPDEMWRRLFEQESELVLERSGFTSRVRPSGLPSGTVEMSVVRDKVR